MTTTTLFLLLTLLLSHAASSIAEDCNPHDKRALLQIKKELNNPTLISSWKPHTDCCKGSWYGVSCFPGNNRVVSLTIYNDSNLSSPFPPSVGNLPFLDSLFFSTLPNLTGPIPHSISKLRKLTFLTISYTSVSGPIPNFKPILKSLANFDLSHNKLSGTLPAFLHMLPNLSSVNFIHNKLTGPIPDSYGLLKTNPMAGLLLSHNQLYGKLPVSLARLNSSIVDLSRNWFEGDASMLFGSTKLTVSIDLSWNRLAFDMGKVELSETITTLDVSHNKIFGNLPVGMGNILLLNVSYNRLCGEIPKGGHLQSFEVYTYFRNKCLCGSPLPSCKRFLIRLPF